MSHRSQAHSGVPRDPRVLAGLNHAFFETSPAEYFYARAAVLMRLGDEMNADQAPASGEFSSQVRERLSRRDRDEHSDLGREDRFHLLTTESFMLAHHAGECLLRRYLAHLEASRTENPPWVTLTGQRASKAFLGALESLRDSTDDDLRAGIDTCFIGDRAPVVDQVGEEVVSEVEACLALWLRHFARVYLTSAPGYNAAKHGLSSVPGNHRATMNLPGDDGEPTEFIFLNGPTLLTLESKFDPERQARRWFQMRRQVDRAGLVASVVVAADLLTMLGTVGRLRHLGVPAEVLLFSSPTPEDVFTDEGRHRAAMQVPLGVLPQEGVSE